MEKNRQSPLLAAKALIEAGRLGDASTLLTSVVARAASAGDVAAEAAARGLLAQAQLLGGQAVVARRHAERGLELARGVGDDEGAAFFEDLLQRIPDGAAAAGPAEALALGRAALEDRDLPAAVTTLRAAATQAQAVGDERAEATARGLLARALSRERRWEEALPEAQRAFDLARHHGNRDAVAAFRELSDRIRRREEAWEARPRFSVLLRDAAQRAQQGQVSAAVGALQTLLGEAQAEGAQGPMASIHHLLAQLYVYTGDRSRAFAHATEGEAIALHLDDVEAAGRLRALVDSLADA